MSSRNRSMIVMGLALLPAILVAFFWARSYLPHDIHLRSHDGSLIVFMTHGYYSKLFDDPDYALTSADKLWKNIEMGPKQTEVKRLKIAGVWCVSYRGATNGFINLAVPYFYLLLVSLLIPLPIAFRILRRRRRIEHHLCLACGYDLRGSPERCPECGKRVAAIPDPAPAI